MQYRRTYIPGGAFFFTVVTHQRQTIFDDKVNIQRLRQSFAKVMEKHPFVIDAIVVLPDHIHCIWTLPPGDADFSLRWRLIKGGFSRACPPANAEILDEARRYKGERAVWQRRFWEHVIRDENDFERHVDYIHYNPVKHGFVKKPNDYIHSSIHRYVRAGLLNMDWGAGIEMEFDASVGRE